MLMYLYSPFWFASGFIMCFLFGCLTLPARSDVLHFFHPCLATPKSATANPLLSCTLDSRTTTDQNHQSATCIDSRQDHGGAFLKGDVKHVLKSIRKLSTFCFFVVI